MQKSLHSLRMLLVGVLLMFSIAVGCSTGIENMSTDKKGFNDCPDCPTLVTIPAGSFLMGTAVADRAIDPLSGRPNKNEEPQHEVTIAQPFALGKYEVSVAEFAAFIAASGYDASVGCLRFEGPRRLRLDTELDWRNPGFAQTDNDPVVCVSLDHALAYTEWLSNKTGHHYYIPSEAQWEYAAKAGTPGRYFWGDDESKACTYANIYFQPEQRGSDAASFEPPCDDGYDHLAPVGSYLPNDFGLHDTVSNVWEWTTDCGHKNYNGAPTDGSPWIDEPGCLFRMIRSGGVRNDLARTTHVVRAGRPKTGTAPNLGFRVARSVDAAAVEVPVAGAGAVVQATDAWPNDSEAGQIFAVNCEPCHTDPSSMQGVYGTDTATLRQLISEGGNNIMSMPAFNDRISAAEIDLVTDYVVQQKGWD
jgi:formylglycine-generating enzyme required for sulfatase activity